MIDFIPSIQPLRSFFSKGPEVDVLNLQQLHPVVSGNKWYKLRFYLQEASTQGYQRIITRGGAYSNHIVAAAWAARDNGLESIGIIRGQAPAQLSPTLRDAQSYGMQLYFTNRSEFAQFRPPEMDAPDSYYIPEGGIGPLGIQGAAAILTGRDYGSYTHIVGACGTGTMITGLALSALPHQQVVGISVLNNAPSPLTEIKQWMKNQSYRPLPIILHYPYGGYAKLHPAVLQTMHSCWIQEQLPLDFVYTGKMFTAIKELIAQSYFKENARILLIHSGGLQGNRSLPAGSLPFL